MKKKKEFSGADRRPRYIDMADRRWKCTLEMGVHGAGFLPGVTLSATSEVENKLYLLEQMVDKYSICIMMRSIRIHRQRAFIRI